MWDDVKCFMFQIPVHAQNHCKFTTDFYLLGTINLPSVKVNPKLDGLYLHFQIRGIFWLSLDLIMDLQQSLRFI